MELVFFISVLFFFFLFRALLGRNAGSKKKYPPGPINFPIVGSLPQIIWHDPKLPHVGLAKLAEKYGEVMSFGLGVHNSVIISSYKLIKEMFNSANIVERYPLPFYRDRNFGRDDLGILFSSKLEMKQYFLRKVSTLGFKSKANLDYILQDASKEIIRSIKEERVEGTGVWTCNPKIFSIVTTNCMWGFVAGYKFDRDNEILLEAVENVGKLAAVTGLNNVYTPFPFLKKLFPVWSGFEEHKKVYQSHHKAMRAIVAEFKERKEKKESTILGCFLEDMEKGKEGFNEEQLLVLLSDLLSASDETTASMMSWIVLYLALYPGIQAKLYEKVVETVGPNEEMPSLENVIRITYAKAFIYEVFRNVNFIPLCVPCNPKDDIEANGYIIRKGTSLLFNVYPVHNDPEYWGDPKTFRPERFMEKDEMGRDKLVKTERVLGFGAGKRNCPGEEFGWNFLQMFTVSLVQKFEFSLLPGNKPSLDPVIKVTLSPAPYSIKVRDRN